MSDARPWANYAQYRPLVELAKAPRLGVVYTFVERQHDLVEALLLIALVGPAGLV